MFDFFRRLAEPYRSKKWRDAQEQKSFDAVFEDIPSDSDRRRMSEKELAEVLSICKAGTPAYILVEHELNLRIAGIQSQATLRSGWLGLLGALLAFFLGTLSTKEVKLEPLQHVCHCEYGSSVQRPVAVPKPPAFPGVVPTSKDMEVNHGDSKGQKKRANGNQNP